MFKYITFLILFPIFLIGQEQVSDITSYGVYYPTNVSYNVGFASIEGTQYLLEEKDSLIISKFENGTFKYQSTIQNFDCKQRTNSSIDLNRSLFEIRNGFYYRFFRDGIQVIDIGKGEVYYEFDFESIDIETIWPNEIVEDRIYFGGYIDFYQEYVLDMSTDNVSLIEIPDRLYNIRNGDHIVGSESGSVYVYNAFTNKDTLIYESSSGIQSMSFSEHDNTFVFLENDGELWKIDSNLNLINTNCTIPNNTNLITYKVNGSKIITVFEHVKDGNFQDSIVIIDLNTCQNDLTILTDSISHYSNNLEFIKTEGNDVNYSIFGYRGSNDEDGDNDGLYYIIDHIKNIATPITDISCIEAFTPFELDNSIYLVGINSAYRILNEYIVKYNLTNSIVTKHDPNSEHLTQYITLGFPEDGNLINAVNTREEDPKIWSLSPGQEFNEVQPLNFLFDQGLDYIENVIPMKDRLYFSTNSGIHSVLDDSRTDVPFDKESTPKSRIKGVGIATFEDLLVSPSYIDNTPTFMILNTTTGEVDSVVDEKIKAKRGTVVGPFIFYSQGNSEDTLHYFDLKTNSIYAFNALPYVLRLGFTEGKNKAFYYHDSSLSDKVAFLIDYKTNEFRKILINIEDHLDVIPGYDDSFYIIDRELGSDNSRIRLLKKNGNVSTIYEGKGVFYDQASSHFMEHPATLINLLYDGQLLILITNDLDNTKVEELTYLSSFGDRNSVLSSKNGNAIIKTYDDNGTHYWFYEAFKPIEKIETVTNKTLAFSDLTDDLAVLVFYDNDNSNTSILKYNIKTNVKSNIENVEYICGRTDPMRGLALSSEEYFITTRCDIGFEPWILNIAEGSFTLISDFNPGVLSSYPQNIIKFKEWIYFVLTKKDKSKQWFRLNTNFPTSVMEISEFDPLQLNIYPSPANQTIHVDQDLKELAIFSVHGKLLYTKTNYKSNQPLEIDFLENGTFFIVATNENNTEVSGKFVKVR